MALAILDGTQTATTLSTILSSGQHITAHTVVSLGTQAITDILNATSAGLTNTQLRTSAVTIGGTVTVGNSLTISSLPAISGTVTANVPLSVDGYTGTTGVRVTGCGSDGGLRVQGIDPSNFNPANLEEGGGIPIFPVNNNPLPISGTVTANVSSQDIYQSTSPTAGSSFLRSALYYENLIGGTGEFVRVNDDADGGLPVRTISGQLLGISGTVTAMAGTNFSQEIYQGILTYSGNEGGDGVSPLQVNIGSIYGAFPAGTNRIGVVTIGAGTVTIGAGTAQIGSVTASISNSVTIASFTTSVTARLINPAGTAVTYAEVGTAGNPSIDVLSVQGVTSGTAIPISISSVTIGSLPAISGTVTANLSISSTVITSGSFSSLTSATLVPANPARKMATVYNLGAGQLFVNAGATATTLGGGFMVALNSGDFYECNYTTTTLSAIFATAGTASWVSH